MSRVAALSLWFLLTLIVAILPAHAESLEREKAAVVRISATVDGKRKTGTGFIVRLEKDLAYILTASHVVEGDSKPEIEFYTRRNVKVQAETARVEADDPRGLALLLVRGKDNLPAGLTALPLAAGATLSGGEEVVAIGFPQGAGPWAVLRADVVSRVGRDLTLGGSIDEGNSGGPVILNGTAVGVVMGVDGKFGLAVPAAIARLVLDGWGVPLGAASRPPDPVPDTAAALRVTQIAPRGAEPADYRGACPVKIDFAWKITTTGGAGKVSYSMVRGDGVTGPVESISVAGAGDQDVHASWTLGRADVARTFTSWVVLRVLAPQKMESDKIAFTADCQPPAAQSTEQTNPVVPVPLEGASIKIMRASCEKLSAGTTFRVTLSGEANAPAGAALRTALIRGGKSISTPAPSCSEWKKCQRGANEPEKTRWSFSTLYLGSPPGQAIVGLDADLNTPAETAAVSAKAELSCYF